MKLALPSTLALVCLLAACREGGLTTSVTTTSSEHGTQVEATLRGEGTSVTVANSKIEISSGTVRVDGVSYGPVANGEEVRYVVIDNDRKLTVDGAARTPVN
ncbi:MAG: hypothetical protein NTV21_05165 [Planctomycetota bacterium]|nr:hypothetical protein [Planctomycetota bacterium]